MIIKTARTVFTVAVILLLLGGLAIVAAQVVGLIAGEGGWLTAVSETLEPPTFIVASVAGIFAFLLSYQRQQASENSAVEMAAMHD
jgi:cytochrome b subunit of formate dehydrogenase